MDQETAIAVTRRFAQRAAKTYPDSRILLFGSRASGHARDYSDIDVAVVVDSLETEDKLPLEVDLVGLAWEVDVHLEPHLMERKRDPLGFVEHVEKIGIEFYPEDCTG